MALPNRPPASNAAAAAASDFLPAVGDKRLTLGCDVKLESVDPLPAEAMGSQPPEEGVAAAEEQEVEKDERKIGVGEGEELVPHLPELRSASGVRIGPCSRKEPE